MVNLITCAHCSGPRSPRAASLTVLFGKTTDPNVRVPECQTERRQITRRASTRGPSLRLFPLPGRRAVRLPETRDSEASSDTLSGASPHEEEGRRPAHVTQASVSTNQGASPRMLDFSSMSSSTDRDFPNPRPERDFEIAISCPGVHVALPEDRTARLR